MISINTVGVALELKHLIETNLIRISYHCISHYFNCNYHLNCGTYVSKKTKPSVAKMGLVNVGIEHMSRLLKVQLPW